MTTATRTDPYAEGLRFSASGQHARAIERFEQALAQTPDDTRVLFALGNTARALGLARPAEEFFRRVLTLEPGRVEAIVNLAYYPPVPQAERLDWKGSHCIPRIGWEWSLLGLSQTVPRSKPASPRPTLLVAMGGSDPHGLTLRTARALARLDPIFRARFVIGPGMHDREKVASTIAKLRSNFETIEGADDLAVEYASADFAIAAFGVTAYELAAFGVPALYLCLTEDHALSASAFEYGGMGISLGLADGVSDERIAKSVWSLLGNTVRQREMRAAGLMTIDGQGASRIAGDLADALNARRVVKPKKAAR